MGTGRKTREMRVGVLRTGGVSLRRPQVDERSGGLTPPVLPEGCSAAPNSYW